MEDSGALPWDYHEPVPYIAHVCVAVYMVVILVVAFFGNGLVLLVFARYKTLKTPGNMLLVNLTVSDILMAVTGFPLLIVCSIKGKWSFPHWVCDFYGGTATTFGLMSINTLVFIAVDKTLAIVNLDRNKRLSYKQVYVALLVIWTFSAAWGLMPAFGWGRYITEGFGTTCTIDYMAKTSPAKYLLLAMTVFDFLIPLAVIAACYIQIFRTVSQNKDRFTPVVYSHAKTRKLLVRRKMKILPKWSPTEYKVAKTILLVTGVFTLSWTPYAVVTMLGQYSHVGTLGPLVSMLPALCAKTSTVFNPVIYSIFHPKIGPCIKRLVYKMLGYRCVCSVTNVHDESVRGSDSSAASTRQCGSRSATRSGFSMSEIMKSDKRSRSRSQHKVMVMISQDDTAPTGTPGPSIQDGEAETAWEGTFAFKPCAKARTPEGETAVNHNNGAKNHNNGAKNHDNGAKNHTNGAVNHNNGAVNHNNGAKNHNNGAKNHNNGAKNHNNGAKNHNNGAVNHNNGAVNHNNAAVNHNNAAVNHCDGTVNHKNSFQIDNLDQDSPPCSPVVKDRLLENPSDDITIGGVFIRQSMRRRTVKAPSQKNVSPTISQDQEFDTDVCNSDVLDLDTDKFDFRTSLTLLCAGSGSSSPNSNDDGSNFGSSG